MIAGFFENLKFIDSTGYQIEKVIEGIDNITINYGSLSDEINVLKGISTELRNNQKELLPVLDKCSDILKDKPEFKTAYINCSII